MGKITEVEYETVEKEVTRYECDSCGYVGEKDEFVSVKVCDSVIEDGVFSSFGDGVLCKECSGHNHIAGVEKKHEKAQSLASYFNTWGALAGSLLGAITLLSVSTVFQLLFLHAQYDSAMGLIFVAGIVSIGVGAMVFYILLATSKYAAKYIHDY